MDPAFNAEFHHRVRLAYEEYLDVRGNGVSGTRRDISRAVEAAKVLYHLRERLPVAYPKTGADIVHTARKSSDI